MKTVNFNPENTLTYISKGNVILGVHPDNFGKMIYIVEHGEEGSVGFQLNSACTISGLPFTIQDLLPEISNTYPIPVYKGGMVQMDTLHMIHSEPDEYGGIHLEGDIYWGGSYEKLQEHVSNGEFLPQHSKLFIGYWGWSPKELQRHFTNGYWISMSISPEEIFSSKNLFKTFLMKTGIYGYLLLNPQPTPEYN